MLRDHMVFPDLRRFRRHRRIWCRRCGTSVKVYVGPSKMLKATVMKPYECPECQELLAR